MELRPHPIRTTVVINPVALLLRFIFYALLRNEYCGDQLKSSLDETSFVSRHINLTVCFESGNKLGLFLLYIEIMLLNTFLASTNKISQPL